jgi:hypothetical protein
MTAASISIVPLLVKLAPRPALKQRVVFEHQHGGAHRVECAAAAREDVVPSG